MKLKKDKQKNILHQYEFNKNKKFKKNVFLDNKIIIHQYQEF